VSLTSLRTDRKQQHSVRFYPIHPHSDGRGFQQLFDFLQLFFLLLLFPAGTRSTGWLRAEFFFVGGNPTIGKKPSVGFHRCSISCISRWLKSCLCLFVRPTIVKKGKRKGVGKVVGSRVLLLMLLLLCIPLPSSMCVSISPCVYFFSRIARLGEGGKVTHTVAPLFRSDSRFSFFFLPDGVSFCHREKKK
jgi:hypothetical protein